MIRTIFLATSLIFVSCAKLDNLYLTPTTKLNSNYLPPNQGYSKTFFQTQANQNVQNSYLPPNQVQKLSNTYLPPNVEAFKKQTNAYLPPNEQTAQNVAINYVRQESALYLPPTKASLNNLYLPPNQEASFKKQPGVSSSYLPPLSKTLPLNNNGNIAILKYASEDDGEGTYRYKYETGNSISVEEQGDARGDGTKAQGSFFYISPEGEQVSITYTADESGFQPQGSHIPTPPPIPEAILKSVQANIAAEARGVYDDGQYHGEGLNDGQYRDESQEYGGYGKKSAGYEPSGGYKY